MHFSDDTLSLIKDRLLVSDIVKRKVSLKQKGKDFLGLCPFHNEKTPSFTVNDQKGFYHCFGCGAHGDVFRFLVDCDKRTFPEAVSECAELAGVTLPPPSEKEQHVHEMRNQLFDILQRTARFYQETLNSSSEHLAKEYLKNRGIHENTLREFQLGYASNGGLKVYLSSSKISLPLAERAGIIKLDGGLVKERFWDRIMFPILDEKQRVVGFGGRVLSDGHPKYLNSAENELFHKNELLYGIHRLNLKADHAILVEGYLDVIAMAQAGFSNVFAPMGTSLTPMQASKVLKHFKRIYLCFDGDPAGLKAMRRAVDVFLPLMQPGIELFFTRLSSEEDPHSVITTTSARELSERLKKSQTLVSFLISYESMAFSRSTPSSKALLRKRVLEALSQIPDNYLKSLYHREVFDFFSIRKKTLSLNVGDSELRTKPLSETYEKVLLKTFVKYPSIIGEFLETLQLDTFSKETQEVLSVIESYIFSSLPLEFSSIVSYIKDHLPTCDIDALLHTQDIHAPFLSEPLDILRIKQGIAEILDYFNTGVSLDQHIADMQKRFQQSQDPKDWEILKRLIKEKAQRHNNDDRYS